ncbi:hypothetical protein ACJJTC_007330 [Scirpophaga incertulas]
MAKCLKCTKLVTKKNPGLQCNKCSKWIHGSCANLSTEQLSFLSTTESADWKCRSCAGNMKPKRLSFIMPDVEDEADTDTETATNQTSMSQKMLNEIKREVRDVVRNELQLALQFYSDKIDEYEMRIKDYENQCAKWKNVLEKPPTEGLSDSQSRVNLAL